jgi:hypothetical protein
MPLVYPPFLLEHRATPEVLTVERGPASETAGGTGKDGAGAQDVILEQDGIHYVNHSVMTPDRKTIKNLDQDFLNLVDSVLK